VSAGSRIDLPIEAIQFAARQLNGGSRMLVTDVAQSVRILTGETGDAAIRHEGLGADRRYRDPCQRQTQTGLSLGRYVGKCVI
jgi:hypothetical protein